MPFIVAIDGPAGAGKSTVARRVARELGLTYMDTGAMYRAVAWKVLQTGANPADEQAIAGAAQKARVCLSPLTEDLRQQVTCDDTDVTEAIRLPEVSQMTSIISALPAVRRVVVAQQRQMGAQDGRGVTLEGRDIGTVVFPHADVKVFLTASPEERARRRAAELQAKGLEAEVTTILAQQQERDARDSQRADSPLRPAEDAVILDTDSLSVEAVVAAIVALCQTRMTSGASAANDAEKGNTRTAEAGTKA